MSPLRPTGSYPTSFPLWYRLLTVYSHSPTIRPHGTKNNERFYLTKMTRFLFLKYSDASAWANNHRMYVLTISLRILRPKRHLLRALVLHASSKHCQRILEIETNVVQTLSFVPALVAWSVQLFNQSLVTRGRKECDPDPISTFYRHVSRRSGRDVEHAFQYHFMYYGLDVDRRSIARDQVEQPIDKYADRLDIRDFRAGKRLDKILRMFPEGRILGKDASPKEKRRWGIPRS